MMLSSHLNERVPQLRHVGNGQLKRACAAYFISESAVWFHPAGKRVSAPRHANRIKNGPHGWEIEFGANVVLIEVAFNRTINTLQELSPIMRPAEKQYDEFLRLAGQHIRGAVANYQRNEYRGYYQASQAIMTFGVQGINVDLMAEAFLTQLFIYRPEE
jgi:hypothetical protein